MQAVQKKKFYVNTWLEKIGYLKYKGNAISQFIKKSIAPTLSVLLSKEVKEKARKLLYGDSESNEDSAVVSSKCCSAVKKLEYGPIHNIDWDQTKAYLVNDWGICIRVDSRGDEYSRIREDIIEKMKNLRDDNGNRIAKDVWKREEIFNGPYLSEVPDIIFIPMEEYGMGMLPSSRITGIINKDQYARSGGRYFRGDHEGAIEGILMAVGPSIKPGKITSKPGLMDIMPTVLHMLGVEIPHDVDGNVLKELFKADSDSYVRDVRKKDYGKPEYNPERLSAKDNEAIIKSLKQMGYM